MKCDAKSLLVGVLAGLAFALAFAAVNTVAGPAAAGPAVSTPAKAPPAKGPYEFAVSSRRVYVLHTHTGDVWSFSFSLEPEHHPWKRVTIGPPGARR